MDKMRKRETKKDLLRDEYSVGLLIMVWILRVTMLLIMMAAMCRFEALPFSFGNNECSVILVSYTALLVIMQNVYHACEIGRCRVSELSVSHALSNVFTAGIMYVGIVLYAHRFFDPTKLIAVVFFQTLITTGWCVLVNRIHFRKSRKPRTVVICQNESAYKQLCMTNYFHMKYDVTRVILDPVECIEQVHTWLDSCEVVFIMNVPTVYAHDIVKLCLSNDIKVYFTPRLGQTIMAGATHRPDFRIPLLEMERTGKYSEYRFAKRIFDVFCAIVGLILTSPLMLLTALAIKLEDGGPVFYSQVRLTKNGREFRILKFRSMSVNAEKNGVARLATQNDCRITKVGKFIRACRIDELPQLINILLGDMSVVGPRPERPEIAKQYEQIIPEFSLRLRVKAGLTGFAQVYGHYNTDPYHKLQMDLMYINDMSFIKDLQLIFATVRVLFQKDSTQGVACDQETALQPELEKDCEVV